MILHPGDRKDRNLIEFGIIEACQQIDAAGSRGSETDPQLSRPFGVGRRHEGRRLLMPRLDKPYGVLTLTQRFHHAIDTIARKTEDGIDVPFDQCLHQNIGCCGHCPFLAPVAPRRLPSGCSFSKRVVFGSTIRRCRGHRRGRSEPQGSKPVTQARAPPHGLPTGFR